MSASEPIIPGPLGQKYGLWRRYWRLFFGPPLTFLLSLLPRALDLVVAGLLLVSLSPLWTALACWSWLRTGGLFSGIEKIGRFRTTFRQLRFAGAPPLAGSAVLLNILRGDMALVGPRSLTLGEAEKLGPEVSLRFAMRPGLVSPFALRRKVGIAYEGEASSDVEFFYSETALGNMGVGARFLVGQLLAGGATRPAPAQLDFFGIFIANTTMGEAIDWMADRIRRRETSQVAFVNPDCLNIAYTHPAYRGALGNAAKVLPDGIGINLGCRMQGLNLRQNVNGTDLFPRLCERSVQEGFSLFLLGARPGVAEAVSGQMRRRFPQLKVAGARHGYFSEEETAQVVAEINASGADILLVAFGAPRQDLWLAEHARELSPPLRIGVGGLFDFYSGRMRRAPVWMREIGMEWVYRLMQEPGRMWRRYVIGNPVFLYRVWRQRLKGGMARRSEREEQGQELLISRFSKLFANQLAFNVRVLLKRTCWVAVVRGTYLLKRLLDIVGSALLMLVLSPVLTLIAAAIKLESEGPVFFKQTRVGRYGEYFTMWKFRSMYIDAEARKQALMNSNEMSGGVIFKMKNDPRITRIGRFIRRASIDELPQLWNVFVGDMSLVGPRPALPSEVNQYSPADRRRLEVIPGITCIWQVSGRSEIPFEQQVQLDVKYIESQSFMLDIKLLLLTIPAVLLGKGAY